MASYTKNLLSVSWSKTQIGHRTEKVVSMSLKSAHTSAGPRQSKASPAPFFSSLYQLGHNRRHNPHHEAHQPNHRDFQAQHRLISLCQYPTNAALQVRSLADITQHARQPRVSYTSLSLIQASSNSKYSTCISGLGCMVRRPELYRSRLSMGTRTTFAVPRLSNDIRVRKENYTKVLVDYTMSE